MMSSGTQPPPDFLLNLSSQLVFVPVGHSSAPVTISATGLNGFSQTVTVTISSLPPGVSVTPGTSFTVQPGKPQAVVFSTASGLAPGRQTITLTASSGNLMHSITVTIEETKQSYLYVSSQNGINGPSNVAGFAINPLTGSLSTVAGSPFANVPQVGGVVADPLGRFLFALGSGGIYVYKIDPSNGSLNLATGGPYPGRSATVAPSGQFLYGGCETVFACVIGYSIAGDGTLGPIAGFPLNTPNSNANVTGIAVSPSAGFAYVSTGGFELPKSLLIYRIDSVGAWTQTANLAAYGAGDLTFHPDGSFLLSSFFNNAGLGSCGGYQMWMVNPIDGNVTNVAENVPVCIPVGVAFHPSGKFLYIDSSAEFPSPFAPAGVVGTSLDASTGLLTSIPGSPFNIVGGNMTIEPTGAYLYALGATVQVSSIDSTTGVPTAIPSDLVPTPYMPIDQTIATP